MTYPATQLITESFYLSGILSQGFQTISGSQSSTGLGLLNKILSVKSVDISKIPYFQEYDFTAEVGEEKYFIPNMVKIESLTFNLNYTEQSVRMPMLKMSRSEYFATMRVNNVNALPYNWRPERTLGGLNIYMYFFPSDTFPMTAWGKIAPQQVELFTDLSTFFDLYYITYLWYDLASAICAQYGRSLQPQALRELARIEKKIERVSMPDLTLNKYSSLSPKQGLNWAYANLFSGWDP